MDRRRVHLLVAIAEVGNGTVVVRRDLIQCLQAQGYRVCRIGQVTRSDEIHPDYERLQVEYVGVPLERTNVHPLRELKGIAEVRRVLKKNEVQGVIIYGVRMFPSMVTAAKLAGVKRVLCVVNGTGRLFRMRGLKGFFVRFVSLSHQWRGARRYGWFDAYVGKPDKLFAVSRCDGEVNGLLLHSYSGDSCTVELLAVSPKATRRGIGSALFRAVEYDAFCRGAKEIRVGTQVRNIPALNLYSKLGCKVVGCHQIYHMWNL